MAWHRTHEVMILRTEVNRLSQILQSKGIPYEIEKNAPSASSSRTMTQSGVALSESLSPFPCLAQPHSITLFPRSSSRAGAEAPPLPAAPNQHDGRFVFGTVRARSSSSSTAFWSSCYLPKPSRVLPVRTALNDWRPQGLQRANDTRRRPRSSRATATTGPKCEHIELATPEHCADGGHAEEQNCYRPHGRTGLH